MAIFSMRVQVIGRSAGRSATAAAAYRSGEEVRDERTGAVHDYTGKSDIYGSEILLPEGAPERMGDRVALWNEVERIEKRKDAQLSREVMIALPAELSHGQKEALAREYVQAEFVSQGMIADIGYHDFESHNPHAHIMLTMRSIDEDGFGKKQREWNKRQAIERHRQAWEAHVNRALERAGYDERIDHRSLEAQGVEREPQIHLGAKVMEMEARGVQTRVGDESRRIIAANHDIDQQAAIREKLLAVLATERGIADSYLLPELIFSSELDSELNQAPPAPIIEPLSASINQPVSSPSVPSFDPELMRRFGEALVRRRDEIILENSPDASELAAVIGKITATMNKLSAAAAEFTGKVNEVLAKGDKAQAPTYEKLHLPQQLEGGQSMQGDGVAEVILRSLDPRDLARHKAQIAEAKTAVPSVEKNQEPSKQRQEPSKQRQKKQAKKLDQGMEM